MVRWYILRIVETGKIIYLKIIHIFCALLIFNKNHETLDTDFHFKISKKSISYHVQNHFCMKATFVYMLSKIILLFFVYKLLFCFKK